MDDWPEESLGSLVSFEYGSALREDARSGSGYGVFGSNGIVGHHCKALVTGPGIIVGRKGSVGKLHWSEDDYWPIDTTYWVRPIVELDSRWMFEALRTAGLESLDSSTGVPGLNRNDAYERRVRVPSLEEQRRIAEILDAVGDAIRSSERVIAKLELTRLGLREHFCAIPDPSAARTKLAELTERIVDCPHSTPDYQSHGVLVARTMHIKNGRFLEANASRVPESTYRDRVTRMTPAAGDVILTREAPVGEAFAIPSGMRICLGQRVVLIRPGPNLLGEFLVELIYSSQGQEAIRRLMAGTTNPHLNVDDIRCLLFEVPSLDEQRRALGALDALSARIEAESGKLEKLSRIRRGVAADLLSGRVRTVAA